jgi:hypothetical protein
MAMMIELGEVSAETKQPSVPFAVDNDIEHGTKG